MANDNGAMNVEGFLNAILSNLDEMRFDILEAQRRYAARMQETHAAFMGNIGWRPAEEPSPEITHESPEWDERGPSPESPARAQEMPIERQARGSGPFIP